jgi:hypothetical protein
MRHALCIMLARRNYGFSVKTAGIKRIARISGVPRSQLQGFVSRKITPNAATIATTEAALERLGA